MHVFSLFSVFLSTTPTPVSEPTEEVGTNPSAASVLSTTVGELGSGMSAQEAIKSQAGCYEVTFQYRETEGFVDGYQLAKPKKSMAVEWVTIEEDSSERISLQHVLVSGPAMIKHWRQVWEYEATTLFTFQGHNTWQKEIRVKNDVTGQWAQRVYNVDDGLRYECIADWNLKEGDEHWRCATGAPLPRRESKRKDYTLLDRTNIHRLVDNGWVHEQLNSKVSVDGERRDVVAKEKGYNTYVKISDDQCQKAIDWWPKRRAAWRVIQRAWLDFYREKPTVRIRESHWGIPLWVRLFWLAKKDVSTEKRQQKVYSKALKLMKKHEMN